MAVPPTSPGAADAEGPEVVPAAAEPPPGVPSPEPEVEPKAPRKSVFALLKKLSVRQQVLIVVSIVLICAGVFFRPSVQSQAAAKAGSAVKSTTQATPGKQPSASKAGKERDKSTSDDPDDEMDDSATNPYPARVTQSSKPRQSAAPGDSSRPGVYERALAPLTPSTAYGDYAQAAGEAAGVTDDPINAIAGAPKGAVVAPGSGKKALLPEVLGRDFDVVAPKAPNTSSRSAPSTATVSGEDEPDDAEPLRPAVRVGATAPFGRLVKCRLVFTVDSLSKGAPIIAMVMNDLVQDGRVVIPALTEVFGEQGSTVRDVGKQGRILDTGSWIMVFPAHNGLSNGSELRLRAKVLDRREILVDEKGNPRSWGIDDGGPGLVGDTISVLQNEELKMMAAAGLSGMTQGLGALMEKTTNSSGNTTMDDSGKNVALASMGGGAVGILDNYASRIADDIAKNGSYVRVAGGKEFYLFVEQSIDTGQATKGNSSNGNGRN